MTIFCGFGRTNNAVKHTPSRVEKIVVIKVGRIMSVGFALCREVRKATMDAGKSCKEVALSTKNIAEAYSAFGVVSSRLAALMP